MDKVDKNIKVFSYKCFALAVILVIATVMVPANWKSRFNILLEEQVSGTCLPFYLMVLDKASAFKRGDVVAVKMQAKTLELTPQAAQSQFIGKIVVGISGDEISIKDHALFVNNIFITRYSNILLSYMSEKGIPYEDKTFTVPNGYIFGLGNSPTSVDSRVIGVIDAKDVAGKFYVIY